MIVSIDTGINPRLCRELTKQLAAFAVERNKQALVTTHNPAWKRTVSFPVLILPLKLPGTGTAAPVSDPATSPPRP